MTRNQIETDERADTDAIEDGAATAHLDDLDDGCGCAEVWEHTSERRAED